jgi:hypothetical protein
MSNAHDSRIAPVIEAIDQQLNERLRRPELVVREPTIRPRRPETPEDYAQPHVRAAAQAAEPERQALPPPSPLSAEAEALRMKEELDAVMKVRDDGKAKAAAATAEMVERERKLGEFLDGIVTMTEARLAEQARRHAALRGYYEANERAAQEAGLVTALAPLGGRAGQEAG